jgi:hypothetical protein
MRLRTLGLCAGVILACGLILLAQTSRDMYRSAYASWRQADPNLERDSAAKQAGFADRVEKVAQAAATYGKARSAFLRASASVNLGLLDQPLKADMDLLPNRDLRVFVTTETKVVETSIKRFETDRDPGIVQWRQALERERAALASLGTAIDDRRAATAKAAAPLAALETGRTEAVSKYAQFDAALTEAAGIMDRETAGWAQYYKALAVSAPVVSVSSINNAANNAAANPNPAPVARVNGPGEGVPPVPLMRYTGTWSFPAIGGLFSGPKPEFVDLAVHEENGQLKGSFYGRFTLPPGSRNDPVLRFDMIGPVTSSRTQKLTLETTEGAKGTIELIPGGAFNLLEINFHIDQKAGKVDQADMILLKK